MATERFHPLFVSDLAAACVYYDAISAELGVRFRDQVRARLHDVAVRPESFGHLSGDYRGAMVLGFPYVIVFTNDEAQLTILGIRHAASDQRDWFSRSMPR
ncbi:MAG: type II toxin-antitoxin system RelE/ParE family toxin [Pirellulaceae bacterium]|nr:type II toxin-antitoxin system RelE/ParE family toxin [Pirellulaceae bacterium]